MALNLPQGHLALHDIEFLLLSSTQGYCILSSLYLAPTLQLVTCFQSPLTNVVLLTLAIHHKLILRLVRFILESRIMYILYSCYQYIRGSSVFYPSDNFLMLGLHLSHGNRGQEHELRHLGIMLSSSRG